MDKFKMIKFFEERFQSLFLEDFYCIADYCGSADGTAQRDHLEELRNIVKAQEAKCGCSKAVFFFDELPSFVVKVPFFGQTFEYWDDVSEQYYISDDIEEFYGADYLLGENGIHAENNWDYCATEASIYSYAKLNKIEFFFAKTEYICTINDIPIYLSEKASECKWEYGKGLYPSVKCKSVIEKYQNTFDRRPQVPNYIIEEMLKSYSQKETEDFIFFLQNSSITDLHDGNWGIINNKIKIIDYSDFED